MLDLDTFLTTLYVMADDFCKQLAPDRPRPGPQPSLQPAEVITLGLLAQLWPFRSERDFYRYAQRQLRGYFPRLPDRSQFNRLLRRHWRALVAFWQELVDQLGAQRALFEVLDCVPVPTRTLKRRRRGWLAGQARIGWSSRLGWYCGFHVLIAVNPAGVITGFALAGANEKDQPLAEAFLAVRRFPHPALPTVGRYTAAYYLADNGFEGRARAAHWQQAYGATVLAAPAHSQADRQPAAWRRWLTSLRQVVESVADKLENWLGLGQDRNHTLAGVQTRLAAKMALHNFLIYLNGSLGRPALAFADLMAW